MSRVADWRVLIVHYRFVEDKLVIEVRLKADRTAWYAVSFDSGRGGIRAAGLWRVDGARIHIYNRPGAERFDYQAAALDARARIIEVEAGSAGAPLTRVAD